MDLSILEMAGSQIPFDSIASYTVFFIIYVTTIIAHAISKLNLLCLFIAFSSLFIAIQMVSIFPLGAVMMAILGVFYLVFFAGRIMSNKEEY